MSTKPKQWTNARISAAIEEHRDGEDDCYELEEKRTRTGQRTKCLPVCGTCLDAIEQHRFKDMEHLLKPASGDERKQFMVENDLWTYNMHKKAIVDSLDKYFKVVGEPECCWFFHQTRGQATVGDANPMTMHREYKRLENATGNNAEQRDEYRACLRSVAGGTLETSQAFLAVELANCPPEIRDRPFDPTVFDENGKNIGN